MARKIDLDAVINRIRMKMQGSHPASPDSGYDWLYVISGSPHGGLYLKDSSGREIGPFITGSASSPGGSGWTQDVSEDGSTFANFTSGGGTWSSDGTVIKQTSTAASYRTAYLTAKQPISPIYVMEADIKMVSAGGGALRLISLIVGYSGATNSQGAQLSLQYNGGTRTIEFARGFTTTLLSLSQAFSDDTFYKLRLVTSGGLMSAYLDTVLIATAGGFPANAGDGRYIGLVTYGCEGHFQNIKGYSFDLPA